MRHVRIILLLLQSLLLPACETQAAGGAHIVDDSEVETPGLCHLELWVTRYIPGDGYFNGAPACTMKSLPMVEIGAAYQHYWDETVGAMLLGPQFKFNFQSADKAPVGFGIGLNASVNVKTGDLGLGQLLALVTIPIDDKIRLNLNAGWSYLRYTEDAQNALFYGGQFEVQVGFDTTLMVEVFGRTNGLAGMQMGLRYTPRDGPFDFDLLFASPFDSVNAKFVTFGVTMRW